MIWASVKCPYCGVSNNINIEAKSKLSEFAIIACDCEKPFVAETIISVAVKALKIEGVELDGE